jgi:hypothetical protein
MVTNSVELPTETCLLSQQCKQAAELPTETCLGSQQNKEAAI